MDEKILGDATLTFEEALTEAIRIESREFDPNYKPNLKEQKTWILKDGPRAYKAATLLTIRDGKTLEDHHHTLTIRTLRRYKKRNAWIQDEKHTVTLSDEEEDEICRLIDGLASVANIGGRGQYLIVNLTKQDDTRLQKILDAIASSGRKVDLLAEVLSWANDDPKVTAGLIKLAAQNPVRSKSLAAGLNYGRYHKALDEFKTLIEKGEQEKVYQKFLEHQSWIFGSEYSEFLDNRRILALGLELDFPLRRTIDGYLEVIEIKRPLSGNQLFLDDTSHDNLYPRSELTQAIAQVRGYLRKLDAQQYRIQVESDLRVEKVRAKVIIGRDGDDKQIEALRLLNADQQRVEVLTYDQLVRIAERILDILGDEAELNNEPIESSLSDEQVTITDVDDIPF